MTHMDKNLDNDSNKEVIYEEDESDPKEKLDKLKKKLEECQQEKEQYLIGWQRAQADLINYKRRQEEQLKEIFRFNNAELIKDLLPFLDALESALVIKSEDEGLKKIYDQFWEILSSRGLEKIKTISERFNPEFHEAVAAVSSKDQEENMVAEELQTGYLLNGYLLRPAKVKIIKNDL